MSSDANTARLAAFIAEGADWIAVCALAGDIFKLLLSIQNEYPPVIGGVIGILVATSLALIKRKPVDRSASQSSFRELTDYLFETDKLFFFGVIGLFEHERLRSNRIRRFPR